MLSDGLAKLGSFSRSGEDRANIFHADVCQEDGGSIVLQRFLRRFITIIFHHFTKRDTVIISKLLMEKSIDM